VEKGIHFSNQRREEVRGEEGKVTWRMTRGNVGKKDLEKIGTGESRIK